MIEYIKGELTELTPALAVVEAAGVGYALNISLTTYSGIQGKKEVKLFVHEAIMTGGLSTMSVYAYCKKNLYKQRIGIKGDNRPGVPLISRLSRDRKGYNLPLQFLGVNDGKQQVMTRLGLEQAGQQYFHFPVDDSHIGQRGYDQAYFKGIIAEQRKVRRRGGMIQVVWETISKVNHSQ